MNEEKPYCEDCQYEHEPDTFEQQLAQALVLVLLNSSLEPDGKLHINPMTLADLYSEAIREIFRVFNIQVPTEQDIKQVALLLSADSAKGVN